MLLIVRTSLTSYSSELVDQHDGSFNLKTETYTIYKYLKFKPAAPLVIILYILWHHYDYTIR